MNSLLADFEKYIEINQNIKMNSLSPTITLPLINDITCNLKEINNVKLINKNKDNSIEVTNTILDSLNINTNISTLKFIFHELIANIYDHSQFETALVMGKENENYFDFSFIDNGISIPKSLSNNNYCFENDYESLLEAINGLSTKNEFGYIERGTGLNNTINITINGSCGEALIISGNGLIHISENTLLKKELRNIHLNGTLVSLRMRLDEKIDIYKYLNQIKYE